MKNLKNAGAGMEQGPTRMSSRNKNLDTAILENLGGCCEGTVFTFTSAGANGRSRQRLDTRYKPSLLLSKEEPTDSVFTEMRMMARSGETAFGGVEVWNPGAKWFTPDTVSMGSSLAVSEGDGDGSGDNIRRLHRMKKISDQTEGDQITGKGVLQEALNDDCERKEFTKVVQEEPTARKSRRYLKYCDNYRERVQIYEEEEPCAIKNNWPYKEEKSGDASHTSMSESSSREGSFKSCSKPVEERRNKRDSYPEEIHVFEQRKVKCARRKEHDSCSNRHEAMQIEDPSKAEDLNKQITSSGFNSRNDIVDHEEVKTHMIITAPAIQLADEILNNQRVPLSAPVDKDVHEDKGLSYISKKRPLGQFHHKRGNGTNEGKACLPPLLPKFEQPPTAPMACSFISFKAGVPCTGQRRHRFAREACLRATPSSDELENEGVSLPPKRGLELAFPRINVNMEGDDETETGAGRLEAPVRLKAMGQERNAICDIESASDAPWFGNEASHHQKLVSLNTPQVLPCIGVLRVKDESSERRGGAVISSGLRTFEQNSWDNVDQSTMSVEEQNTLEEVNVYRQCPRKGRQGLSPLVNVSASRLLDWYGSIQSDNGLEITDLEGDGDKSIERDSEGDFTTTRGTHGPSLIQELLDFKDHSCEGSLNESQICQLAQMKDHVSSGTQSRSLDGVTSETDEKLSWERTGNSAMRIREQEPEKFSLKNVEKDFSDGKLATESCCPTLKSEYLRSEVGELGLSPQKSVPLRRQAWVKGFKKKTGDKVSYFEKWLGRGKKDPSSMKLYKKCPGVKGGLIKGGELSEVSGTLDLKLKHILDKSCSLGHSIDEHLVPQSWSKNENQAYVTKEFELLEAVLQSHSPPSDRSEVEGDCSQHKHVKDRPAVGLVDEKEEGRQEQRSMLEEIKSLELLDHGDMTSHATKSETKDTLMHWKRSTQEKSYSPCGWQPKEILSDHDHRTYKSSAKLVSCVEHEMPSHVQKSLTSDSTGYQARKCKQSMEDREDPLASSPSSSSTEDLNLVTERLRLRSQDEQKYRTRSEKGVPAGSDRQMDEDMSMVPQEGKKMLPLTLESQGLGLAEQCRFVFEKQCSSQEKGLTMASDCAKGMKDLIVQDDDSRDISAQKGIETRNAIVTEKSWLGVLTMEISGISQLNSTGGLATQQSLPSNVTAGSEISLNVVESSVQIVNLEHSRSNRVPAIAFSQQLPSPVQDPKTSTVLLDGKQVKDSSVKELESLRNVIDEGNTLTYHDFGAVADICQLAHSGRVGMLQSSSPQVMVGSRNNSAKGTIAQCTAPEPTVAFGNSLTESETAVKSVDLGLECNSSNFTPGSDFEAQFLSCVEVPRVKEVSEDEKYKSGSPVNRRHKMPIIVRVRNRLANGWLLQHSLWKRVAKQKMKTTSDSPVLAAKGFNQKERQMNPSNSYPSQGSAVNPLKGMHQTRTEKVIDTKPESIKEKEQPSTKKLQKFILEAGYGTIHSGASGGDLAPSEHHKLSTVNVRSKHSTTAEDSTADQNQRQIVKVNSKQATSGKHDTKVEQDHAKTENSHCDASAVVNFAKWQSQSADFGNSGDFSDKVGTDSVSGSISKTEWGNADCELVSTACLGNREKEATVLEEFSDYYDDGEEVVCLGQQERQPVQSQMSSDCIQDVQAWDNNSKTTNSNECQMEQQAEADVRRKEQVYIPLTTPVNLSLENCSKSRGEGEAESDLIQKSRSLPQHFALDSQNKDLHICSAMSSDHGAEGTLNTLGMMHLPARIGDSMHEQPCLDCQKDNKYFLPMVEDVLDYLSVEPTRDIPAAPAAASQYQSRTGEAANKEQHKSLSGFVQPFGHARAVPPFYPPLQGISSTSGQDKLIWAESPIKDRDPKDQRRSKLQKRGMKEALTENGSLGDLKHWELMEMMKLPDNQQQTLPGHTAKALSGVNNHDHVYNRPSKPKSDWHSCYQGDCDRTQGTAGWKAEPTNQNPTELPTEEQVFLERFSALSNNQKMSKLPERPNGYSAYRNTGFNSLGQPNWSSSPDLSRQTRLLSATTEGICTGRPVSLSRGNRVEPASQPTCMQLINLLHPNVSNSLSLGEARRPDSSEEYPYEEYNTFESHLLPEYAGSFDCVSSPNSSRNESLEISERHFNRPHTCADCLNKYDHREARGHGAADGLHARKSSSAPAHFPSLTMHNSSFLAHYQNLLLNPRQSSCSSHMSQSTTPIHYDPCNIYQSCPFPPSLLQKSCHLAPFNATMQQHQNQCHFVERSHPVPALMPEPAVLQQPRAPFLHECGIQHSKRNTMHAYSPLQIPQSSDASRSWSHRLSQQPSLTQGHRQFEEKNRGTHICQEGGQLQSNPVSAKEQDKGLVWLSEEEMNLIWQLRFSSEQTAHEARPKQMNDSSDAQRETDSKWRTPEEGNVMKADFEHKLVAVREKVRHSAVAVCRHDAAACIQRNWRKHLEKRTDDLKLDNGQQQATGLNLLTIDPMWHDHLQNCKIHQAAISLQHCGPLPKELGHVKLSNRWYTTMQKAASIIQRAWRLAIKQNKIVPTAREWPKDLKNFYDMVKKRHVDSGSHAPSLELFTKSVQKIQAATEGARVRRRLKSRRLQTIIMEIKEIRVLLFEMSQEGNCDSTAHLFPQLSTQLQKKILQLHTALSGEQMEAQFLLRRGPATPLSIYPSRSASPKPLGMMVPSQRSVEQALLRRCPATPLSVYPSTPISTRSLGMMPSQQSVKQATIKLSSGPLKAKRFYAPPLTVVSDNKILQSHALPGQSAVSIQNKVVRPQYPVSLIDGSKGKEIPVRDLSPDPSDSTDPPDSAKLLPWYFLAQRSPSKRVGGQGTPVDYSDGHESSVKEAAKKLDSGQIKPATRLPSHTSSPKLKAPEYTIAKTFDEQPLPPPQRRTVTEMSLEEMAVGGSNAGMYITEYGPSTDQSDKPKRPFLKRKSIAMPSQKLDWSKVKPMVSSRLEPELKTKLSFCKGPPKEPPKINSKKKKANYSKIKSRLFSYEENVSPRASGDGTVLRAHTTEAIEAEYPQVLRSFTKGSSTQRSENWRNSRALVNRHRAASPDLMRLRYMAEAERDCSQTSMVETQSMATYSSRFNSARYLHKLGNSEQASKGGTLIGSCQQRTRRIRLRILPRSKENEVEGLFVQEINMQEEMQELWEDQSGDSGKGKRQQSHSHRYAIYQESPEPDAQSSSRVVNEDTRPSSPQDSRRRITSTSLNQETQDPTRSELYLELN